MAVPGAIRLSPSRPDDIRARNQRIAAAAHRHRFESDARVPFLCECSDNRCQELLRLQLETYETARDDADYLTAPGHQVERAKVVRLRDSFWLYRKVTDARVP
jgi:hypothetical protein